MAHPSVAVLEYHLAGYRRVWLSTVASSLAMPILFFIGMGLAVGSFVDRGGALPVPYLQYIAPGLIAFAGLQIAVGEGGFPVLTNFKWQKVYDSMAAAPLRVGDMILGRLGYIAIRVMVAAIAFLVVMLAFGTVGSVLAVVTPVVVALVGVASAAPMFALAASVNSANAMAVISRIGVLPMMLFSGVFFPVEQLPAFVRPVAYVLPLWNGVELCRATTLAMTTTWPAFVHVAVLVAWAAGGFWLAWSRFRKRLGS
ncbi:ABC transporter permease [Kibdelosporangium persicum]|uniref:Transport permease protein n=1 Tax=Kibdelosporangium persicum TaxID=2698649 RepID=A0ABX2FDH9_9PSEU|nr:ABC transporter permease [Kibdelosporangium persicum]NRN69429.1 ABC transporter [Kibdelosporangium persicum]